MSLEGLRAWIGEVERKLGKRTRVFLALAVIAVGLGGAAIYLAIDARESSVSETDVQKLQQELEAQIDEAAGGTGVTAPPIEPGTESVPDAEAEQAPDAEPTPDEKRDGGSSGSGQPGGVSSGSSGGGASDAVPGGAPSNADIQGLLKQAEEQNAEAEKDQAGN